MQLTKRILILEDDYLLSRSLRSLLTKRFLVDVDWTDSLEKSIQMIDQKRFDLLIVDWLLKEKATGIDLVDYAHSCHYQIKTLMLTCKSEIKHRIKAYRAGADAYLTKPFNTTELSIKVSQLLNLYKLSDNKTIQIENITLYPSSGQMLINQKTVFLRPKETQILEVLMTNEARVLSKEKLLNIVWSDYAKQPGLNTVEVYVRRLRQKLGPYSSWLQNKRGFGYCFNKGKEQETVVPLSG
jgi:DNA-binding response OmpR family regulator